MTIFSATPKNATATVAIYRQLTQTAKERQILLNHPTILWMISQTEAFAELERTMNAVSARITLIDTDSLVGSAVAEGALPLAPSTLTVTNRDAAPTRMAITLFPTDQELASMGLGRLISQVAAMPDDTTDEGDLRSVATLAQIMGKGWGNDLIVLVKAILSSLGNTSGAAGTDYTNAAFRTAVKARRLLAKGKGLCLLQNDHGWGPMEGDIISTGGAYAFSALAQRILAGDGTENMLYPDVYKGTDVLVTTGLPVAPGADQYGGCIYPGCLALRAHRSVSVDPNRRVILSTPFFEVYALGYDGGSVTKLEIVYWMGLAVNDSNLGFRILHD